MMSFASYAFNKAHAAAYAYVSYQTAWLKCHYPCEFFAALLTSFLDKTDKIVQYIGECSRLGIKILPPHINQCSEEFAVSDGNIHFSLTAVKNLGRGFIRRLSEEREKNGKFKVAIVLPKGTNYDMPNIKALNDEDKTLRACNKWLLAHKDASEASDGAYIGLTGENIDIADIL